MSKVFYKTDDGKIYQYLSDKGYYLLRTPWETGEDRRKQLSDLTNPIRIGESQANKEINDVWRNTKDRWQYNGKTYEARGSVYDEKVTYDKTVQYSFMKKPWTYPVTDYTELFKVCPEHKWHHVSDWVDREGNKHHHEYDNVYYLCSYQGKLVWAVNSQYIPRVYYYQFESIDKEPDGWHHWTSINCIKPVYCITDKKFI